MNANFHSLLLEALLADDPVAALLASRVRTSGAERVAVDRILNSERESDGFRLSSLLVKKLRFERLYRADNRLAAWFDRDPGGFAAAFREYHQTTPPREFFGHPEARAFLDDLDARGLRREVPEIAEG